MLKYFFCISTLINLLCLIVYLNHHKSIEVFSSSNIVITNKTINENSNFYTIKHNPTNLILLEYYAENGVIYTMTNTPFFNQHPGMFRSERFMNRGNFEFGEVFEFLITDLNNTSYKKYLEERFRIQRIINVNQLDIDFFIQLPIAESKFLDLLTNFSKEYSNQIENITYSFTSYPEDKQVKFEYHKLDIDKIIKNSKI